MKPKRLRPKQVHRRGAMLVLIAVCLPLCVIMAAFAVDVAWMQLVRTELRTATDAAARAGAKGLSLYQDRTAARNTAKQAAGRNRVAGAAMVLADQDVEIGVSQRANETSRFTFALEGVRPNAVRVTGRRTSGSAAGAVNLLFSGVLGVTKFEPVQVATSSQLDRDICLVIDRSTSMMQEAVGPTTFATATACNPPNAQSRWAALDAGVDIFLAELDRTLQQENVSMVSYGSNINRCGIDYRISTIDSDLVADYTAIRAAMARIGGQPVHGFTHIGEGMTDGVRVLTGSRARPFAIKTMILMTDGIQNGGIPAINVARQAARRGIKVHTITFSDEALQEPMREVAAATGGVHFHASDPQALVAVFKEIAATLPVLTTE